MAVETIIAAADPSVPIQLSPQWWMGLAPGGVPYYHNTKTGETTWVAPMLSVEADAAATTTNLDQANKD